jgi:GAF domain-containing protein
MNTVLQTIVQSAVDATAASQGWVLALHGDEFAVVAATGGQAGTLIGVRTPAGAGTAGFVVASGQPMAMAPRPDDPRSAEGIYALLEQRPTSVLCVPCGTEDEVVGVLELVDKVGGGTFSFDDVELATLLAGIAGSALDSSGETSPAARSPAEFGAELQRVAAADPSAYGRVASVLEALLARG